MKLLLLLLCGLLPIARSNIPCFGGSIGVLNTVEGVGVVRFDGERVW